MKIRLKILLGFIILAVMLIVAGVFSIHELTDIGASVQHLLDDNYQSINAAKIMIEGLERQDLQRSTQSSLEKFYHHSLFYLVH